MSLAKRELTKREKEVLSEMQDGEWHSPESLNTSILLMNVLRGRSHKKAFYQNGYKRYRRRANTAWLSL